MKKYWENKNILILGGAGFIGSHLCDYLVREGHNVICVDNFVSSDVENIRNLLAYPNFEFIRHDVTEDIDYKEAHDLEKFKVSVQGFQEIYNLACPTSPKDFSKLPVKTAWANSIGVIKSLELAKDNEAKFLLTSTSSVYGNPPKDSSQVKEDYYGLLDFLNPRSCYNEGKRFAESTIMTYHNFYKLNTHIARIFNTYGTNMLQHIGRQIPDFIKAASEGVDIEIAGDENTVSSFCNVKDIITGLIKLMDSDVIEPVNLGDSNPRTLKEVAEKIIKIVDSESKITYAKGYDFTMKPALPNIDKAKEELDWIPLIGLDAGLAETIDYYKNTVIIRKKRTNLTGGETAADGETAAAGETADLKE